MKKKRERGGGGGGDSYIQLNAKRSHVQVSCKTQALRQAGIEKMRVEGRKERGREQG